MNPFLKYNLFYTKITPLCSSWIRYFPRALFKKAFTVPVRTVSRQMETTDLYNQESSSQIHLEKAHTDLYNRDSSTQIHLEKAHTDLYNQDSSSQIHLEKAHTDLYNRDSSSQIHLQKAQTVRHVTRGQYGPVSTTCYDLRPETSPLLLFNGGQDCGVKE